MESFGGKMSLKKQYLKTKPICKVTFRLPKEVGREASKASVVGEFNEWNIEKHPMKGLKNGAFTITLNLPIDKEYEFRYVIDQKRWENDTEADKHVPNGIGNEMNSVVVI